MPGLSGNYGIDECWNGLERSVWADVLADPCPCDGCTAVQACIQGLACRVFANYVRTGRIEDLPKHPDAVIWRRLFEWSG